MMTTPKKGRPTPKRSSIQRPPITVSKPMVPAEWEARVKAEDRTTGETARERKYQEWKAARLRVEKRLAEDAAKGGKKVGVDDGPR